MSKFLGYYMHLLTHLSISDAVQSEEKYRQTDKISECRKFLDENSLELPEKKEAICCEVKFSGVHS